MVTDRDRYLFDTFGYVVLRGVLRDDELSELNLLLDVSIASAPETNRPPMPWHEQIIINLVDDDRVLPYLDEWLGVSPVRFDHAYSIVTDAGDPGLVMHHGGTPFDPGEYYVFHDGRIHSGLSVVSWQLTDVDPGAGGFACIPGSHKANFRPREEWLWFRDLPPHTAVEVPLRAGDVLIFTEALTHGTWAWRATTQRRSLLYKYAPGHMAWGHPEWPEDLLARLTERQRLMFEPPYIHRDGFRKALRDG